MLKIRKIQDNKMVEVLVQENCTRKDYSHIYVKGQNCLYDCTASNRPRSWKSKEY